MMPVLKRSGKWIRNLSPAAVREIAAVFVILTLAVALILPQFFKDKETAKLQQETRLTDGFKSSAPEMQGMDSAILEKAPGFLDDTSVLSILIVRNGSIVYEKYFGSEGSNNIFSITKSFISSLTGIAIQKGFIHSVDDTVETYLPEYFDELQDKRWKKITIRHLLTMTPGFCEDLDSWTATRDWVKSTFELPLQYEPGEKFQYANSASHLLSVILTEATGMSTKDFADLHLFRPLGIASPQWATDPGGYYTGYANLYLSTRELAKFGWLYQMKGKWNGIQILPEQWVEASTKVQYDFNKETDTGFENGYGYKWWISGKTGYHTYSALGYGGQSITVIPDLGLEVVITCMPGTLSLTDGQREQLIKDYIIQSITDKRGGG